jgi:hypothetical protein
VTRRTCSDLWLDKDEAAMIRAALADCSALLTWALGHADEPAARLLKQAAWITSAGKITPGHLLHDISLSIDYLDVLARRSWR